MEFKKYLKQTGKKIDKEVQKILSRLLKEVKREDKTLVPLIREFIRSCKGGKGIRGVLVKLGYEIAMSNHKSKTTDDILKVGAAYEIFHNAILIHDDIIDKSSQRRGRMTLHKSIGPAQAITLADLGFFLAVKVISETDFDDKKKNKAINFFAKTMMETAVGQMLDIKKGDVLKIMRLKTALYTIAGPLKLGAILAGAQENLLEMLESFGEDLGIAFQIQDDILDKESLSYTRQDALKYVVQSKQLTSKITPDPKLREILTGMADYLVDRKK